jgi:hypothetical protein
MEVYFRFRFTKSKTTFLPLTLSFLLTFSMKVLSSVVSFLVIL